MLQNKTDLSKDKFEYGRNDTTSWRVDYADESSDKPWVILIHGVGMSKKVWETQRAPLSRSYNLLTYDTLGHGDSELPSRKGYD